MNERPSDKALRETDRAVLGGATALLRDADGLRCSVLAAQSRFLESSDHAEALRLLVESLVGTSNSSVGFAVRIVGHETGDPRLEVVSAGPNAADFTESLEVCRRAGETEPEQTREDAAESPQVACLSYADLAPLLGGSLTSTDAFLVSKAETDPAAAWLCERLPSVSTFVGLPIRAGRRLLGALCLAGSVDGYSPAIVDAMRPALDSLTLLFQVMETEERCRRAERALLDNESRLRLTTEAAGIGTWEWDCETDVVRSSAANQGGYQVSSGDDWLSRVHPEDRASIRDALSACANGESHFRAEFRVARQPGVWSWVLAAGGVVERDAGGKPSKVWGISFDTSAQRIAEQDSLRSLGLLQQIVDALPQRVFWKDREGRYLGANRAFHNDSGCDPVGLTDYEMPWTEEQADFFCACDRRVAESERAEMDILEPILTEDGKTRILSTCKMPLHDAGGRVFGVLGTYLDITAIKENEVELSRARDAAEAATMAKSDFLATMSHEIRTPLNGVLGYVDLVLETSLDADQRDMIETVRSSGVTLLQIINDILDFSKLEAGKFNLDEAQFDLRSLVADVLELLAPQAHGQGVELALTWESEAPPHLIGDVSRVRQVLINLVGNAIKFSKNAPVTVIVDGPTQDRVRFRIVDLGVGIPLQKQESVFERFTQADSSPARSFGGTGLGLAISKRLVEAMGGEIGLVSEPGAGTTFWFVLPSSAVGVTASPQYPGRRALVISEVSPVAQSIDVEFRRSGVKSEMTATIRQAEHAMRAARSADAPFDLIVVDARLADVAGSDLVPRFRDAGLASSGRVALLTDRRSRSELARYKQWGFDAIVAKPVTRPSQLWDLLSGGASISDVVSWQRARASIAQVSSSGADMQPAVSARATSVMATPTPWMRPPPEQVAPATPNATTSAARSAELPPDSFQKPGDLRPIRVLLAEDNLVNQKLARRMLEGMNCVVEIADNGLQAVSLYSHGQFDLIFMDCQMPKMDGFEAAGSIRKREVESRHAAGPLSHVPIVALTANALTGDRERCLLAGMDDYISKPFQKKDLARVLRRFGAEEADRNRA